MKAAKEFSKDWSARISVSEEGWPCIAGAGTKVHDLLQLLAAGNSISEIRDGIPSLKDGDIEAALQCAAYAFKKYNQEEEAG